VIYRKLEWLDKDEVIKRFVALEFNRFLEYYRNAKDINVSEGTFSGPSRERRDGNSYDWKKKKKNYSGDRPDWKRNKGNKPGWKNREPDESSGFHKRRRIGTSEQSKKRY
jgi:hypothetical protein